MIFGSAHTLVKIGLNVSNIGFYWGSTAPHFYVSSNGDSHVMLVSTFSIDTTHLGTIGYPTTTTHIYFTTYYPPSGRQWVTCHAEFLTLSLYLSSESASRYYSLR